MVTGAGTRINTPPITFEILREDTISDDPHNALSRLHPDLRHWVQTKALADRRSVNTWLTLLLEKERDREAANENGHTTGNLGG